MNIKESIIDNSHVVKGIGYKEYRRLVDELFSNNQATGDDHSEKMLGYTRLNIQRMNKWDKKIDLTKELVNETRKINNKEIWLVLTEGWCGDAAQNLPIINKVAEQNSNIDLRFLLRDQNLDLMDQFLTNGGRSIPKLIVLDAESLEVKWEWGPRPKPMQDLLYRLKSTANFSYEEFSIESHTWYAKDKGRTLQTELLNLLRS